jgi:hypothetical protein
VRHAAVLFVDIRGFTSLSEAMRPDEVVRLLNFYFDRLGRVIVTEQGILNKYIGDAMMAVFGAPVPLPNPAATALRAAVRMRDAVDGLTQEQARGGLPALQTHWHSLRPGARGQYRLGRAHGIHRHWRYGESGIARGGVVQRAIVRPPADPRRQGMRG